MRPASALPLPPVTAVALLLVAACDPTRPTSDTESVEPVTESAVALTSYFPPPERSGGWRKTTDRSHIRSLGLDPAGLDALGSYLMSLPYESYSTGVSGYKPSNKAAIVVKNGWIAGEYYNQPGASTAVYYLASNGKTFTLLLAGHLGMSLGTRLYDQRWLPQGYALTDRRKANITFDHVFRHVSGIVPEAQAAIASGAVESASDWNFAPFTVGKDPDYPVSAKLYFTPGDPSGYAKSPYSSVAFNHFSLIFRNVTGLEASTYFRRALLDRIGVGRVEYKLTRGMGDYRFATAGNALMGARDFARIGYLMMHEGNWSGTRIFPSSWLRQFTTSTAYPNLRTNRDCRWGRKYPADMYRTIGSGQNWVLVVPSLDLVVTFTGRTPARLAAQVDSTSLARLFAAVKQRYVGCDGKAVN